MSWSGQCWGEVSWSLERCCRGTSPAVQSDVPGSQPQQNDGVNLEVWGSILSLFSSASPFLPPCSLPPLDDVTAPCCQGLCMHVTHLAQFPAFHGSGWKSFMFVTAHDYVFLPICLTCSFAFGHISFFLFCLSPLQLF